MPRRFSWFLILTAIGLVACTDYYNRTYRYHDEIPMAPFAVKLERAEFGMVEGRMALKMFLHLANRSTSQQALTSNQFILRVGKSREIVSGPGQPGSTSETVVSLDPGKEADVVVPFAVSRPDLDERLDLILGWADAKARKHRRQTLIEIKKAGPPRNLPREGEWLVLQSARW